MYFGRMIGHAQKNDDDEGGDDLEAPLDMGTLGFATWIVGLGKASKKRLRVVKQAIASAQRAVQAATTGGDVAASQAAAVARAQVEHVCRVVER